MKSEVVKVYVDRYDPGKKETYTQTYEVPRGERVRVLDFLDYIFEEMDPSLSYRRHLCKAKMCHACMMMVNDNPRLVCWEVVSPGQDEIKLSPLKGKRVLKDLIVDFDEKVFQSRNEPK